MSVISILPEEVRNKADELEKCREQHLDLMRELRILVMNLSDIWQGEAQEAFVAKFVNRSQTMNEFAASLEEFTLLVREAVDEVEQMDASLKSRIDRLG